MASRPTYSHSRLAALEQCPRQYRYRYVERLAEAFRTVESLAGTLVHEALGWLYLEREARREPTADELVARFDASWRQRVDATVRIVKEGATAEDHRRDAQTMLRSHHATTFRTDRRETLAVEPRIDVQVGGHAFMGYVDRLARDAEGRLHVIDYKTTRRPARTLEEAGPQVRAYGLAVLEKHGGLEVALEYDWLWTGTQLREVLPRARCGEIADGLRARIEAALEAERAGDFPARPSRLCAWCGYRELCDESGYGPPAPGSGE